MTSLALTLGHNSSAVLIEDGEVLLGYEEERLTGIKADSSFPKTAIMHIGLHYDLADIDTICVSHWETYGEVNKMDAKHWDIDWLEENIPNASILSHHKNFTHHDAHMNIAVKYSGLNGWVIVADGFGNFNEVVSIYYNGILKHRAFGYDKSLGLLYQYATAFLGMKMNQDEYKLLGYEAHADELTQSQLEIIDKQAIGMIKTYYNAIMSSDIQPEFDALCNMHALPELREAISKSLTKVVKKLGLTGDEYKTRIAIAVLVQRTCEEVMVQLVRQFDMKEVTLVGGVFYNVKVNNRIMKEVDTISVCPLAGDQGCGMGVYEHYFGDLQFPHDLCIGARQLGGLREHMNDKFMVFIDHRNAIEFINVALRNNQIVNVVHGNMEFGPRALGNTTTLMLPTMENVEYVNSLNGRSTIMPCAPITTVIDQFEDHEKVVNSLAHMIITLDYKENPSKDLRGAAHKYPFTDKFSGRPQLIDKNHWLYGVVDNFGTLVNTSYNKHGSPILFNVSQILETFDYQLERDVEDRMLTIIC